MNDINANDILSFELNEQGKLLAKYEFREDKPPLTREALDEVLASPAFAALYRLDEAISGLIECYANATENFVVTIAERRDGQCLVAIDNDRMAARLTLIPPYGGLAVERSNIEQALAEKGVVFGIMNGAIDIALRTGNVAGLIVARGTAPVPGCDAQFQSLVPELKERKPQIDEHGNVDYRNLGQMVFVKKGNPLMRRIPPTPGSSGQDVTGQVLAPKPGRDQPFAAKLQGAEIDPDDSDLLRAGITGQPKIVANGVAVDPVINFQAVDISTGNISFDGSVVIKGDVKEGMKVRATGDVMVGGTVEAAEIEAGGNVVIKGGVIGHGDPTEQNSALAAFNAKIVCQGSISTRYVENVQVEAGMDINIEEYAMHSRLISLSRIVIGKSGGKKGHVIGGIACATQLVQAGKIGSSAGFATKVRVGYNPHLHAKLEQIQQQVAANAKELEDLDKIIAFFTAHPERHKEDLLNKAVHTKESIELDNLRLREEQSALQEELTISEHAQVAVDQTVFYGSEIQIGNHFCKPKADLGKGVFRLVEGEIRFANA